MEIRKAGAGDFELIRDIKLAAKKHEQKFNRLLKPFSANRKRYLEYLQNDLTDRNRAVFFAVDKNKPVGIITGRIYNTLSIRARKKKGHISNLYVLPGHREKGTATKLTRELLKWFRKKKIRDIHLGVFSKNSPAQKLFARLGFKTYVIEMEKH